MNFNDKGQYQIKIKYLQNFELDLDAILHIYPEENQVHFSIYGDETEDYLIAFDLCHDEMNKIFFNIDGNDYYTKCIVFSYSVEEIILIQKGLIVAM